MTNHVIQIGLILLGGFVRSFFLKGIILLSSLVSCAYSFAAPYKVSFGGTLNHVLNQGQLAIGDQVIGEVYYDTNLIDVDQSPNIGKYPGAFARIQVRDLYFEFSGYMFTNSAAVFSFQSQSPIMAPSEVSYFVEVGFYIPVLPGYGADLPASDQWFKGPAEVAFNFQSVASGILYYDVISAVGVDYMLMPVPEPDGHLYAIFGMATLLLVNLSKRQKRGKAAIFC